MGFFDSFEKFLNEVSEPQKKKYNETELRNFFIEELHGWRHDGGAKYSTDIDKVLAKKIEGLVPDVHYWELFEGTNQVEKTGASTYKVILKGQVKRFQDSYGTDICRFLLYEIVIHCNEYAELLVGRKPIVRVFDK